MCDTKVDNNYIQKSEERVKYLEEVNRSTLDTLDMMVTLGGNLSRSQLDVDPIQIFRETEINLKRLYSFCSLTFLVVNEVDHDLGMAYCNPNADRPIIQKEIDININKGNLAWALRHNRAVLIPSDCYDGKKLIFHSLTTKSQVVGMFLGMLSENEFIVGDISSDLFSIILYNCAQALENSALYKKLKTSNKQLTCEINERMRGEEHRRKLEHQLMQQSRLSSIGLLTAGIAHNLRRPLTGLMGYIDLAQSGMRELKDLDKMMNMARNMEDIIQTMLIKSRRSQEKEKNSININDLLSTELSFLESDPFFKHKVEKEYHYQDDLPLIQGIYSDFSQGLMNIIHNGLHAMHQSKLRKLTVKTWSDQNSVNVSISDTGCGIAKENIPKLFTPFFSTKPRSGSGELREPTGTGLGLYSSYQLLQPYGVKFHIESELEKGTAFLTQIPFDEQECERATILNSKV